MFKFMHGGWFTVLIAGIVCSVMIVWYKATLIRGKFIEYYRFADYTDIISDIKADSEIPKYSSNLVYLSRSRSADEVESKLIYSIINKRPKRADHYWIVRVEFTDAPDTLEYEPTVLIPGTLISFKFRIGFRIRPQVSVYLRARPSKTSWLQVKSISQAATPPYAATASPEISASSSSTASFHSRASVMLQTNA